MGIPERVRSELEAIGKKLDNKDKFIWGKPESAGTAWVEQVFPLPDRNLEAVILALGPKADPNNNTEVVLTSAHLVKEGEPVEVFVSRLRQIPSGRESGVLFNPTGVCRVAIRPFDETKYGQLGKKEMEVLLQMFSLPGNYINDYSRLMKDLGSASSISNLV